MRFKLLVILLFFVLMSPTFVFGIEHDHSQYLKEHLNFVIDDSAIDELSEAADEIVGSQIDNYDTYINKLQPIITAFDGDVNLKLPNQSEIVSVEEFNTIVPYGTVVKCDKDSIFELTWPSGVVVTSNGNVKCSILKKKVKIQKGGIIVDYPGASGGFEVLTPFGSVSCKGTLFATSIEKDTENNNQLSVKVYEGKVQITDKTGQMFVKAGNEIFGSNGSYSKNVISPEEMKLYAPQTARNKKKKFKKKKILKRKRFRKFKKFKKNVGIQGGMLNFDSTTDVTTAPSSKLSSSSSVAPMDKDMLELLKISNTLSEAIGIIHRLQKRKIVKDKDWKRNKDWIALKKFKKRKKKRTSKLRPKVSRKLSLLYIQLATRKGILQRLCDEDLLPYDSFKMRKIREKYDDFLTSGRAPANRKEWLVKRIIYLHDDLLRKELRKTDKKLSKFKRKRNPFAMFFALKKLIYQAELMVKMNDKRKKKILRKLKKAKKIRNKRVLDIKGFPPGLIIDEVEELNHVLKYLRVNCGFGSKVPKEFTIDEEDCLVEQKCQEQMEEILDAIVKYTSDKNVVGRLSLKKMVKDGYIKDELVCPLKHAYSISIARSRKKGCNDLRAVVMCPIHGMREKIIKNKWNTNKKAKRSMKLLYHSTIKYLNDKGILTAPTIKQLIAGNYIKAKQLFGYPSDGTYSISCTEDKTTGTVKIAISHSIYGQGIIKDLPISKVLKNADKMKKKCFREMRKFYKATVKYLRKKEPSLKAPSVKDLVNAKLLKKVAICPDGGKYSCSITSNKLEVTIVWKCSKHGKYKQVISLDKLYKFKSK